MSIGIIVITLGLFLGWYNNKVVPVNPTPGAHYLQEPHNKLSFISDWDGPDYLRIASHGYANVSNANFFPLYPLAVHAISGIIGSPLDSALLISWISFVGAIYFFIKIIKKLYDIKDNKEAIRGLLFFVLFPGAIFLMATYTEALFAFLALGSIYYTLERKYIPAAFMTMFCTATHVTGIFLLLLIGMLMLEQKEKITKLVSVMVVGSFGLLGYMYFLWLHFRQPLSFVTAQQNHGWLAVSYSSLFASAGPFNAIIMALLLASVIYWWPRRKSFSIYSLLFLLIPLIGKEFGGFSRYALMAFPLQFMLYEYLRHKKTAYFLTVVFMGAIWTFFLLRYAGGYTGG